MIIAWLIFTWMGGIAAILGGLMTLASLLLWTIEGSWQRRLTVLGFSLGCTIVGFLMLQLVPFSSL